MLSSHIIAICVKTKTKNPLVEEIASVAMSVLQNMHLIAANHGYGAYWSSGGVQSTKKTVKYTRRVLRHKSTSFTRILKL